MHVTTATLMRSPYGQPGDRLVGAGDLLGMGQAVSKTEATAAGRKTVQV